MNPPPPRRGADVTLGPGKYQKYRRAARVGILADPTFLARTPTTFYSSLTRAFVRLYRAATYFASTLRSLREEMETSTALARARPRFNAALTCRRDETRDGGRRRVTAQEERRGHEASLSKLVKGSLEICQPLSTSLSLSLSLFHRGPREKPPRNQNRAMPANDVSSTGGYI